MNVIRGMKVIFLAGSLALAAVGCSTMDSAYQGGTSMTNPDKMTLRSQVKWMNPMPNLRIPPVNQRAVYVRIKNSSGSPMDMAYVNAQVRGAFGVQGYRVTMDPNEAFFVVQGDVRFFGESSTKDGTTGTVGGAIVGGVAGGIAGHAIGGNSTGTVVGAAGGALLVGWLMDVLAERNKMVEYDLVVDLNIGERIATKVRTQRSSNQGAELGHSAAVSSGGNTEYGSSSAETGEKQQVDLQEDFLYQKNTMSAAAVKMRMLPAEAFPVLTQKIATSLSEVLP